VASTSVLRQDTHVEDGSLRLPVLPARLVSEDDREYEADLATVFVGGGSPPLGGPLEVQGINGQQLCDCLGCAHIRDSPLIRLVQRVRHDFGRRAEQPFPRCVYEVQVRCGGRQGAPWLPDEGGLPEVTWLK